MWPYFCHSHGSMCEEGLYFYITKQEICVILHAPLADTLPMIVLLKMICHISDLIYEYDFEQDSCVDLCTVREHSFHFFCCFCCTGTAVVIIQIIWEVYCANSRIDCLKHACMCAYSPKHIIWIFLYEACEALYSMWIEIYYTAHCLSPISHISQSTCRSYVNTFEVIYRIYSFHPSLLPSSYTLGLVMSSIVLVTIQL